MSVHLSPFTKNNPKGNKVPTMDRLNLSWFTTKVGGFLKN
ncbi:conserved hypothetical protein [delta proteobacterium NaphS2]|nr:conserved hypothetical protein [delta proteobacterium NaphS2]